MTIETIQADMIRFVQGRAPTDVEITAETDLLDGGVLDSLMVMDLVAQVEAAYGVVLRDDDISPRHLRTIARLAALIASRASAAVAPKPHFVRQVQRQQG